ncbi:MAG: hypothetical protein Q9226_008073, partial [Calogaya cf. arnoldii]
MNILPGPRTIVGLFTALGLRTGGFYAVTISFLAPALQVFYIVVIFLIFNILFEVTSGYGTVGLTTGVPYDTYSLSDAFHKLSKVIMLFVMDRGRHRGVPLAIDRSILIPGEELLHQMNEEYNHRGGFSKKEERRSDGMKRSA